LLSAERWRRRFERQRRIKLDAVTVAALKMPDVIAKMKLQRLHAMSSTPAKFAGLIVREVDERAKIIPSIGIRSD
jgi:tripartite-type tricarboxylate transporter receptor subunit TctC